MPEIDPENEPENDSWPDDSADHEAEGSATEPVDSAAEHEESGTGLSPTPSGDEDLAPGEAVEQLLPALEQTGHEGVDAALATLDGLASASVDEHVAVFEATHEELRRALTDVAATVSTPAVDDPAVQDPDPPHSH